MILTIRAKILRDAVDRLCIVATRGAASHCEDANRVVIEAKATEVVFRATNGLLIARLVVRPADDPPMQIAATGEITVAATDLRDAGNASTSWPGCYAVNRISFLTRTFVG